MCRCTVLVGNMNVQYKQCETVYHRDGLCNLWSQATVLVVAICTIKSNTFYASLKLKKHGIYPLTSTYEYVLSYVTIFIHVPRSVIQPSIKPLM